MQPSFARVRPTQGQSITHFGCDFQICIAYSHAGLRSVRGTQEIVRHCTTSWRTR